MIKFSNVMTLDHFNDFYYLEAVKTDINRQIAKNPDFQFRHSVVRLIEDANFLYQEIAENLAERTFAYIWAACLGEARHASDTMSENRFIKQIKQTSRGDVFSVATKFAPTEQNIKAIIEVFSCGWRGSFGGKAWQNIAKSLLMRDEGAAAFIDHVIDLEHNNGTVFSKGEAREYLAFSCTYDGLLKEFLDYKFRKDILRDPYYNDVLLSREVYSIVMRHNVIFEGKPVTEWVKAGFRILPAYGVKWGKRKLTVETKWRSYTDVRKSNSPTIYDAYGIVNEIIDNNIWKSENALFELAYNTVKEFRVNLTKMKPGIRKAIKEKKFYNASKLAMIPCTATFGDGWVKIKTHLATHTYYVEHGVHEEGNPYVEVTDSYLVCKSGILYVVCKHGEIKVVDRLNQIPYWIQQVEA